MNLVKSECLVMSSIEMAQLTEKRHDSVKRTIETLSKKGLIQLPQIVEVTNHLGQTVKHYEVKKRDSYVIVAQLSPEFTARLVDRWQELESKASLSLPDFSNPAEAARAWAEQYEGRLIAERTKAEIGSRREATAMNTASQAVKRANALECQLDKSKEYITIKRMSMIHHGQPFDWREMKQASALMNLPPIDVFDQNYGTVKAYHADVWLEVYGVTA